MPANIHRFRRSILRAALLCSLLLSLLPLPTHAQIQQQTRRINGFDISGRFLQVWSSPGSDQQSIYLNGLPITPRRAEISLSDGKTYDTQWFERASYQHHPQHQPPYDVQLALLGSRIAEGRASIDPATKLPRYPAGRPFLRVQRPADTNATTKLWFPETGHTLSGKFLQYWQQYGGLPQFGFPISEPFDELSPTDGKTYSVQYFERNRFELHPDKPAPYEVELGLLGAQLYMQQAISADQLPIAPPTGVTSAKGTFTQGSLEEPIGLFWIEANITLDELAAVTAVTVRFAYAITFQDQLVGIDDKGNYFPLAAWYVPTFENGGTYYAGIGEDRHLVTKYKLRPGIKWSDGVELTSNDAVFSHKLTIEDPQANWDLQIKVSSVDNPDKYTAIYNWMSVKQAKAKWSSLKTDQERVWLGFLETFIKLNKPLIDPNYPQVGTVHPQHILSTLSMPNISAIFNASPVGYGPYKVQEWKPGDSMTLVQNEHYSLTGKPLIKKIVSKFNTDSNANIDSFLTGNLDGIAVEARFLRPDKLAQVRASGEIVDMVPGTLWAHIDFLFTHEPFKDRRVREAIIRAINRKQILDGPFNGAGEIIDGPVPPSIYHSLEHPEYARNFPDLAARYKLPTYDFNPAKANQLLDQAGWKAPCGDPTKCTREKQGVKLAFEHATIRSSVRQAVQTSVEADLKLVGVEARLAVYSAHGRPCPTGVGSELEQSISKMLATSNFDAWDSAFIGLVPCVNRQQYVNPKVDTANRLFKTEVDRNKLAEQSAIIQVELMNDVAIIPLVQRSNIEIYTSRMKNRKTSNGTAHQWWNITQWYFDP